jgi:hypothetical protein
MAVRLDGQHDGQHSGHARGAGGLCPRRGRRSHQAHRARARSGGVSHQPLVQIPDGLHLVFLPPYSPELQPAEHLWRFTDDPLVNQHFATLAALEDTLATRCDALQRQSAVIRSATLFHWWIAI